MKDKGIIGIITAVETEITPFLEEMESPSIIEQAMLKIYSGYLKGIPVAAVCCGIGRTNAAIAAQLLVSQFNVHSIINSGTAGAMDDRLSVGDIAVCESVCYHDLPDYILSDFHPYLQSAAFHSDQDMLEACRRAVINSDISGNVFFGRFITGDVFVDSSNRRELINRYHPLCTDMETAAVAHVCYANQIPFFCARAISDSADQDGLSDFGSNAPMASRRAFEAVIALLQLI